jgi:hypothetical protein
MAPKMAKEYSLALCGPRLASHTIHVAPRWLQDGPKGGFKIAARWPQCDPKMAPRWHKNVMRKAIALGVVQAVSSSVSTTFTKSLELVGCQ